MFKGIPRLECLSNECYSSPQSIVPPECCTFCPPMTKAWIARALSALKILLFDLSTFGRRRFCIVQFETRLMRIRSPNRAQQKDMHEFHADRDHAMCNIQNRSIPVVQLTQIRKLSNKILKGTGVLKSSQKCQAYKVAARQWRCLAERVNFSGRCSRCLVFSLVPCPTLPN
jgi:hypothetical protein